MTGRECSTGCSGTGAKFPAIWTFGSAVLGSGCCCSFDSRALSIASKAMAAALCRKFHCWGTGFEDLEEGWVLFSFGFEVVEGGKRVVDEDEEGVCLGIWRREGAWREQVSVFGVDFL